MSPELDFFFQTVIELSAREGHLYFVAAQHILNTSSVWRISHFVDLSPQGRRLTFLDFSGSFQVRAHRCDRSSNLPSEIRERRQCARK